MKLRNIALALALCVPLVSTSYAQQIPKSRQERLTAVAKSKTVDLSGEIGRHRKSSNQH
jgi:hypothetical protein